MNMKRNRLIPAVLAALTALAVTVPVCAQYNAAESVTGDARKDTYVQGIMYNLSAEVKGLQKQGYVAARNRLDEVLQNRDQYSKPLAIISDIDLTICDDTTFQAEMMMREGRWDSGPWNGYYHAMATTADQPMPGAVEFFNYAAQQGVEIFYISNREWDTAELTAAQLKHWGLPYADLAHIGVMNHEGSGNKDERRAHVTKDHDVIMYLGDSIGDFTSDFHRTYGPFKRTAMATSPEYINKWGHEWIIFPNASYGQWAGAVWFKDKKATPADRSEYARKVLEHYRFTNPHWDVWYDGFIKDRLD